jgi:hypothetical protein
MPSVGGSLGLSVHDRTKGRLIRGEMGCTFCLCPAISFFWFISARISAMFWVVITFVALTVIAALSG